MASLDIPGRIRGALIGRPHDTATYDDVLDARPRPLPVLAERLADRWNIKSASAYRRLEAFLRDGESMHTDRVSALLEEVGLTVVPGEGYKYSTTVFPPVSLTDKEKDSVLDALCNVRTPSEVEPE